MHISPSLDVTTDQFLTVFTVVIAFYFGTQAEKRSAEKAEATANSGTDQAGGEAAFELCFEGAVSQPRELWRFRAVNQIKYLVFHYTGNDGDQAANNAAYFSKNNIVQASARYFVDDTTVWRSVPDLKVAWAVGGKVRQRRQDRRWDDGDDHQHQQHQH